MSSAMAAVSTEKVRKTRRKCRSSLGLSTSRGQERGGSISAGKSSKSAAEEEEEGGGGEKFTLSLNRWGPSSLSSW